MLVNLKLLDQTKAAQVMKLNVYVVYTTMTIKSHRAYV